MYARYVICAKGIGKVILIHVGCYSMGFSKAGCCKENIAKGDFYKDGVAIILLQVGMRQDDFNKRVIEMRVLEVRVKKVFFATSEECKK